MYLPDAIAAYCAELETTGLAPDTVRNRQLFLARLGRAAAQVARERGKRSPFIVREIDSGVIAAYFATCTGSQGNRNNMTVALRQFLKWCELTRLLPAGDSQRLLIHRKHRPAARRPKHYVPVDKFQVLIDSAERHPCDRAVVALTLYTLCRRSEIAELRLKQVNLAQGTLHVYRQKRRRWTDIAICPELMDELVPWLEYMAQKLGYGTPSNMLSSQPEWRLIPRLEPVHIRATNGQYRGSGTFYEMDPLSPMQHMERIVKRGLDATGAQTIEGKAVRHVGEGMHTIRRSGARAMLKHLSETLGNDRALTQVATMLDHEDTRQTLAYIGMDQEREELNSWLRGNSMYGTSPSQARYLRAV